MIISRGEPLARILPIPESISDHDRRLVAAGILKLPFKPVNWKEFFAMPGHNLSRESALKAILDEREESR